MGVTLCLLGQEQVQQQNYHRCHHHHLHHRHHGGVTGDGRRVEVVRCISSEQNVWSPRFGLRVAGLGKTGITIIDVFPDLV